MANAKVGDTVRVSYVGKLSDGTVFDSTNEGNWLELVLGDYGVLPSFEDAIVGLAAGETTNVSVAPADAYGEYHDELLTEIPRTQLPADAQIEVGAMLQVRLSTGDEIDVTITEVNQKSISVDGNHPLAGKELEYEICLIEISNSANPS